MVDEALRTYDSVQTKEIDFAKLGQELQAVIPQRWQEMAGRYITPDLKEYEEKVLGAEEKIKGREYELFLKLRDVTAQHTP